MLPCIVIPIYKKFESLETEELLSLSQCFTILNKYKIFYICPEGLEVDDYISYASSFKANCSTKQFDPAYFQNIDGYNLLLRSSFFYCIFKEFDYFLVYQTDAFVFRDELLLWCNKGYDYIGAPWNGTHFYDEVPLVGVGNGGFSLRNTKNSLTLLKKLRYLEVLEEFSRFNFKGIIPRLPRMLYKMLLSKNTLSLFEKNYSFQEDVFWGIAATKRLNSFSCNSFILKCLAAIFAKNTFKVAPLEIAIQFSFETEPKKMYKVNNNSTPFGCHAWEKYDRAFWKPYILKNLDFK